MQWDDDLYAEGSNVMIKLHIAKEYRLLLVGAGCQSYIIEICSITHELGLAL
jgi:hypothetical protein